MSDRIETVYKALDEMAHAILENDIPLHPKNLDPNRNGECVWPDTFVAWKAKVIEAEKEFGREPLTPLQWTGIESYMVAQYGFAPIEE